MATIRIRFVAGAGLLSAAIRAAQLGFPYTHVDVECIDGLLGAHLDGVRVRPRGYDAGRITGERSFSIDVPDVLSITFHDFLRAQIGKPYDVGVAGDFACLAFAGAHAAPDCGAWRDPEQWFCSELVAAALVHAGILPGSLADEAHHVTPQCLAFAIAAIGRPDEPR